MSDSKGNIDLTGNMFKIPKSKLSEIKDYQVFIGFSGFGNVGYLSLTHIVESIELESIAFWGNSSWFHKGRLESLLTVYQHKSSKNLFILPRIPIPVSTVPQRVWDELAKEILSWNCRQYIVIGGLREDTRTNSSDWAAYVPTPAWQRLYQQERSLMDHLAMIGPLSSFITLGTTFDIPVMGLLAYCTLEEDPIAALVAVENIEKLSDIIFPIKKPLIRFDYSFVPTLTYNSAESEENAEMIYDDQDDDDDDDMPGYDLNELI